MFTTITTLRNANFELIDTMCYTIHVCWLHSIRCYYATILGGRILCTLSVCLSVRHRHQESEVGWATWGKGHWARAYGAMETGVWGLWAKCRPQGRSICGEYWGPNSLFDTPFLLRFPFLFSPPLRSIGPLSAARGSGAHCKTPSGRALQTPQMRFGAEP